MKIKFKQDKITILRLLESSNIKRKIRILDRLNGVNEKDSIKILLKVLEDTSWTMREKAARKLAGYGNRVVPRLERLLTRGYWFTRAAACLSLGEIANIKVVNSLIELVISDENPTVRKEASTALVKIATKEPFVFSEVLKDLSLDGKVLTCILEPIENAAPDIHDVIKEELENV
ncbi:MAG: HEAT repeat domain-containing protein [bacterium]